MRCLPLSRGLSEVALADYNERIEKDGKDLPPKKSSVTARCATSHRGTQTIPDGAAEAIQHALIPADGSTGAFSGRKDIVPW